MKNNTFRLALLTCFMSLLAWVNVYGQQQTVAGIVADGNTGEPLIGVSIIVKGTTMGNITDINGAFTLDVPSANAVLTVSYIGYVSKDVPVNGKQKLDITLFEDMQVLNEVIVTGYGAVLKKNLTTAIAKISADEVQKTGVSNASQMLMGRAAGLQATIASAQPGGAVDISIRGAGTPIYVVDGIVQSAENNTAGSGVQHLPESVNRSGLAGINPEDIESIEILKDASAAIYGIGAANGVILITTKNGKEGKLKLAYGGSVSTVRNYSYIKPLNARDYMNYSNLFQEEQYLYANQLPPYGNRKIGDLDDNNSEIIPLGNLNYPSEQINNPAYDTPWLDEVLRNGSINEHNLTLQGGSKDLNYYISGSYFNQIGSVQSSGMERYTLHSRVNAKIFDFLKLGTNINFHKGIYDNSMVGAPASGKGDEAMGALASAMTYLPITPIKQEDGTYTELKQTPNPAALNEISNQTLENGTSISFTVDVDIIKNMLTAKALYGYNSDGRDINVFIPSGISYNAERMSRGSLQTGKTEKTTLEGTVSFTKSFNNVVNVDAVAGMGRYFDKYFGFGDNYSYIHNIIGNDNIGAATGTHNASSSRTENEKRSQFARASLDILDRYVVSGSLRRDGTDKFFEGKKYAFFPSASVAWKIFNEDFIKDIDWISMLKLRASYGTTGNDNLGTTLYGGYNPLGNKKVVFNGKYYIPIVEIGKDYYNVTWEKTIMKNIGLDFSIFKGRLSGGFDYFRNDITDMLNDATTAEGFLSMYATYPSNFGHIRRYGWDASLNSKNIQTANFRWTSILTLSHYNSIWIEQDPGYYNTHTYAEKYKGEEPVNAYYFFRTEGLVNAEGSNLTDAQRSLGSDWCKPGVSLIKDKDGNGKIDDEDIYMVNQVPDLYWGFGNTFVYKNWDLDIFIYSQLGQQKYNYSYDWTDDGKLIAEETTNQSTDISKVWTSKNQNGTIPGLAQPGEVMKGLATDIGWEDASFLRVRNITLGYNLNGRSLGSTWQNYISHIRIYADVQNPFVFTSFGGIDPEVRTGDDYRTGSAEYPQTRTFSLGAKISF